jgi:predicted Holliday junction resolvase-like endonuclease
MRIPGKTMAETFVSLIRTEDKIAGLCPSCDTMFKLSEVELFYIPDRKDDFLSELRKREAELDDRIKEERVDAIKRSRASLMGNLFETVRPFLPEFSHHPGDLRSIWDPVDYISFNGLALNRDVDSVTFVEVKSGRSSLSTVERSIKEAVENGNVNFETVTRAPTLEPGRPAAA